MIIKLSVLLHYTWTINDHIATASIIRHKMFNLFVLLDYFFYYYKTIIIVHRMYGKQNLQVKHKQKHINP